MHAGYVPGTSHQVSCNLRVVRPHGPARFHTLHYLLTSIHQSCIIACMESLTDEMTRPDLHGGRISSRNTINNSKPEKTLGMWIWLIFVRHLFHPINFLFLLQYHKPPKITNQFGKNWIVIKRRPTRLRAPLTLFAVKISFRSPADGTKSSTFVHFSLFPQSWPHVGVGWPGLFSSEMNPNSIGKRRAFLSTGLALGFLTFSVLLLYRCCLVLAYRWFKTNRCRIM